MAFRVRPIRARLYLPVVRWGVADRDWPLVILIPLVVTTVLFVSDVSVRGVPLALPGALLSLGGTIGFFSYIRKGKRPFWLQHKVAAMFTPARRRRRLPLDRRRPTRPWVADAPSRRRPAS